MAEIRKHNPAAGALGDLVRAAIGDGPRPVEPGARPGRSDDPFDATSPGTPDSPPAKVAPAATFVPAVGGWKAVSINALPTVAPAVSADEDEELESDLDLDDLDDLELDDLELDDLDD